MFPRFWTRRHHGLADISAHDDLKRLTNYIGEWDETLGVHWYDHNEAVEALAGVAGEMERLEQEVARLRDGVRRIEGHFGANEYEDCTHRRRGWRHSDCLSEIRIEARSLLSGGQAESTKEQG